MDVLTIRLAAPEDAAPVSQLVDAAYSKWITVIGRKPMPMTADYPALIDRNLVYVLDKNDSMAAVLVIWPQLKENTLYIDNVAVHPDEQRQGLGEMLLDFAEQKAREEELPTLSLMTNAKMESNQNYYRKHGFVETRRDTIRDGRQVVWMHKSLV